MEEWTTKFFNERMQKFTKLFWKLLKSPSTHRSCSAKWRSKMKISAPSPTTPKKNSVFTLQLFKQFLKILIDWRFLAIWQHWFGAMREKKPGHADSCNSDSHTFYTSAPMLLAWASHDLIQLGSHTRLRDLRRACVDRVVTMRKGPSSVLVSPVGIRMSWWEAISPGCSGTRELCPWGSSVCLIELKCSLFSDT